MQIDFREIGKDWVAFTDITTPDADTTYHIQNRGSGIMVGLEASSEPTTSEGVLVQPMETLVYKKGEQALYLKAYDGKCYINTTSEA